MEPYANDINVSPKYFVSDSRLAVAKMWGPVIQGEGPHAGTVVQFLRLSGCNRGAKDSPAGCSWCDASFHIADADYLDFPSIYARLVDGPRDIVVSGGEPLLQYRQLAALIRYVDAQPRGQFRWHLETNGDYLDRMTTEFVENMHCITVSPKYGNCNRPHLNLTRYLTESPNVYWKLLVSADPHSPYHGLPEFFMHLPRERAFLQPLTVYERHPYPGEITSLWTSGLLNMDACRDNHAKAAELAIQWGVRVSSQTHLLLGVE